MCKTFLYFEVFVEKLHEIQTSFDQFCRIFTKNFIDDNFYLAFPFVTFSTITSFSCVLHISAPNSFHTKKSSVNPQRNETFPPTREEPSNSDGTAECQCLPYFLVYKSTVFPGKKKKTYISRTAV